MKKYNIYAIGNALLDIEYHTDEQQLQALNIDKGVMTLIDAEQQFKLMLQLGDKHEKMASGGSAANTVIALCDFGGTASFSCRVADDEAGKVFLKGLQSSHVDTNADLHLHDGVTGHCLVFVTPDADRTMNTFLGASAELHADIADEEAIKQSDYVYIEGYLVTGDNTRAAAVAAKTFAEKHNVKTALTLSDPAMVQFFKDGILEMLGEGVDLLFANEEEAMSLTGSSDFDDAIEQLKKYAKQFAVTRGKQGAYVFDGEQAFDIKPYPVAAIDTLGAGDSFAGAFLYGITHGMTFAEAGQLASMTSSKIVTQYGPRLAKNEVIDILNQYNAGK